MSADMTTFAHAPATDTAEIRSTLRGPAIFAAETVELLLPTKPELPARRRAPRREWAWFAAPFAAGALYLLQIGGVL